MKKTFIVFILLSFLSYSGCATIFLGDKQQVEFSSEPAGAAVMVNGNKEANTPCTVSLMRGKEYVIEFVKEGYESKSLRMTYHIQVGWLILDIFTCFIGIMVDAFTGDWNSFDITAYKANLNPKN